MLNEVPNPPNELFKYRPKTNNSMICSSYLIGTISLKPKRTRFKAGIYLTSYKGVDSRYLEDVLSIGYTPFERCSIDLQKLLQNYILVNNGDKILTYPVNYADITRVWPAFSQIGGASEFIAIPKQQTGSFELYDIECEKDFNKYIQEINENCLKCLTPFSMSNATRFQLFKADSVSRPIQNVMYNYLVLLQIFMNSAFFGDDGLFSGNSDNSNGKPAAFFKISSSGLAIKHFKQNITLSAGINETNNVYYVYLIGSEWQDYTTARGITYRSLNTTKPFVFYCSSPSNNFISPNQCASQLNTIVSMVTNDIRNRKYTTRDRRIRLPLI
jgi:hypothetical protein